MIVVMFNFHALPLLDKTALVRLEDDAFHRSLFEAQLGNRKRPFTPSQVARIYQKLCEQKRFRDLTLFTVGIDIMCRSSDMLSL